MATMIQDNGPIALSGAPAGPVGGLATGDVAHFVEMSPNCLVVIDRQGRVLRANDNFSQSFDLSAVDRFAELFHAQDRVRIESVIDRLAGERFTRDTPTPMFHACEGRLPAIDGTMRWLRWELFPNTDSPDGDLLAIGRDMTAIKAHEQALLRKQAELTEAESIARMGRWHWEVGQPTMGWSPQLYEIFGRDPQGFTPGLEALCAAVHPQDSDRLLQVFQRAMIERASYEIDLRVGEEGTQGHRVLRCEGRCEMDEDGDVVALYGIMQDITARVLYERDLRAAKEEAERASAAKSQFLANMSHELRTPLNAVIGFSEIMQSQLLGPFGNDKYGEYVNSIHESGRHLLALISDILDMSKIQTGNYQLAREPVNMEKLVRLAAHMMEGHAQDSQVHLTVCDGQDLSGAAEPTAHLDRKAAMQIALNLLSNAVKFTPAGGSVSVSWTLREDGAQIVVTDTGIGIPPGALHKVTDPFEQADGSYERQHEGSGLGLAITKDLVDLHGGHLSIDSALDAGTTVTVWLPSAGGQDAGALGHADDDMVAA